MDGSSGVGDVTSSTGVGTSDSGDGGGSNANGGERGGGGDLGVAGDDGSDGVDGVGHGDGGDGVRDDRGGGVGAHNRGNSVGSVAVVGLSLSLPLAVVQTVAVAVAKTVSPVATVVAAKAVSVSVVGISLGLSLSLPLAVVESMAVAKAVGPVATVVATKAVAVAVVGISLRLGLGLSSGEGRKGKCQDLREKISLAGILVGRREKAMLTVFIFPLRLFATNRAPQNPPLPFIPNQPTDQPYRPLPRQLLSPRSRRKCQCTCGARQPIWFLEILYTPKPQMSDGHRPMHFWHFPYRYLWLRIFFLYRLTPVLVSMRIKFF